MFKTGCFFATVAFAMILAAFAAEEPFTSACACLGIIFVGLAVIAIAYDPNFEPES